MSGQRGLLNTAVGRISVALLGVATAVLLAPVAAAAPESDADAAITGAWEASGGAAGPLGERQGGVYPAGEGFAADFTAGKMFFTPDTGAHYMQGAILEKYEALGGAVEGDLGFPRIDESRGLVGPDSRNVTFSAADRPVIFWTAETGAHVVRGAINAAWDRLGGSSGPLGVPAEDEAYRGEVISQKFTGGELSWNRDTGTFTTVPPELAGQLSGLDIPGDATSAINAAQRAAGGPMGPLGDPVGQQYPIGSDGAGQDFTGGKIFYHPTTGANVVTGQVLEKYESVGGPLGELGFPTSNETDGGFGTDSRISTFAADDNPAIFWTPDHGAVLVQGPMKAGWDQLGGPAGQLGAPTADQSENDGVIAQTFTGGEISWDRSSGQFTTNPPELAGQLSDVEVPGEQVPAPDQAPTPTDSEGSGWNWWWLLAIIPALLVAGLIAGAVWWNRRRDRDDGRFDDHPFGGDDLDDEDSGEEAMVYLGGPVSDSPESAGGWGSRWGAGAAAGVGAAGLAGGAAGLAAKGDDDSPQADRLFGMQEDPDAVDTAPTRIVTDPEEHSGRHAAAQLDEAEATIPAVHLPLDDPHEVPDGYPIKADTKSGLYWSPGERLYDEAVAEIWFASEELARTNGFVKGD